LMRTEASGSAKWKTFNIHRSFILGHGLDIVLAVEVSRKCLAR
jgi:hypothetical protein